MLVKRLFKRSGSLVWILGIALALRLALLIAALGIARDLYVFWTPDTFGYAISAGKMVESGRFTNGVVPEWAKDIVPSLQYTNAGGPELFRTPGYPTLLIAGIVSGHLELVTIVLQILLSTATVYLIDRMVLALFDRPKLARVCALLYAVEPLSILYCCLLLTETLFTFLIVTMLYQLVIYLKHDSAKHLFLASIALAAAVYVRPIAYFLPFLVALLLCLRLFIKTADRRRVLMHTAAFGVLTMGLVGLWQLRNYVQTGYTGFTAVTDLSLYYFQGASVQAQLSGRPFRDVRSELGYDDCQTYCSQHPELRDLSWAQRYQWFGRQGRKIVFSHPFTYAGIHARGVVRQFLGWGTSYYLSFLNRHSIRGEFRRILAERGLIGGVVTLFRELPLDLFVWVALGLASGMYYLFSVASLLDRKSLITFPLFLTLTIAFCFAMISGGPNTSSRFRHPIMPQFSILAGCGLLAIRRRMVRRRSRRQEQDAGQESGAGLDTQARQAA